MPSMRTKASVHENAFEEIRFSNLRLNNFFDKIDSKNQLKTSKHKGFIPNYLRNITKLHMQPKSDILRYEFFDDPTGPHFRFFSSLNLNNFFTIPVIKTTQ